MDEGLNYLVVWAVVGTATKTKEESIEMTINTDWKVTHQTIAHWLMVEKCNNNYFGKV